MHFEFFLRPVVAPSLACGVSALAEPEQEHCGRFETALAVEFPMLQQMDWHFFLIS